MVCKALCLPAARLGIQAAAILTLRLAPASVTPPGSCSTQFVSIFYFTYWVFHSISVPFCPISLFFFFFRCASQSPFCVPSLHPILHVTSVFPCSLRLSKLPCLLAYFSHEIDVLGKRNHHLPCLLLVTLGLGTTLFPRVPLLSQPMAGGRHLD